MTTFALQDLQNLSLYGFCPDLKDLKDLNEDSEMIGLYNPALQLRQRFRSRPATSTVGLVSAGWSRRPRTIELAGQPISVR